MESQSLTGDALVKVEDKKGKEPFSLCGLRFSFSFKNVHHGKVTSQDQHELKATGLLGKHFDSKYLVNGSARVLQGSRIYSIEGINFVFRDTGVDADFSNVLTKQLQCLEIWSGKVNQVVNIAFETVISHCINQDGCGTMSGTLILSKESADVRGIKFNQPFGKVELTEHMTILLVPFASRYTVTEEIAKEIAEKFRLHHDEGIRVVYWLGQSFCVTEINAENVTKALGNELPGQVIWEPQHQLKLTEFVAKHFKVKEDLANGSDKGHVSSSSHEGDKHLPQGGDEFGRLEGASASSSGRATELTQGRKPLKFDVQKLVKRKKF